MGDFTTDGWSFIEYIDSLMLRNEAVDLEFKTAKKRFIVQEIRFAGIRSSEIMKGITGVRMRK